MLKRFFQIIFILILLMTKVYGQYQPIDLWEDDSKPDVFTSPLCVSLGSHCAPAAALRKAKLRKQAFPFDWIIFLNHEKLLSILNEDFRFFTDESYFIRGLNRYGSVGNIRYALEFTHERPSFEKFHEDPGSYYPFPIKYIKNKYERRINRFRKIRQFNGKAFFVRMALRENEKTMFWETEQHHSISEQQALELKEALTQYFPELDFTLIICNYLKYSPIPFKEMEGIIEIKMTSIFSEFIQDLMSAVRPHLNSHETIESAQTF